MATDLTEIIRTAAKIKDETVKSANTASRVGGCLLDLAAFAAQGIFADEIAFESAADGVSVLLRYHNAQGQPYERRAFIPALNPAAGTAGVLTPAQYTSMKAFGAVYDVGVFTGTDTAWAACATAEVAGNSAYRVLKYQIGTVHYYIEQSVRDNFCTQYLFEGQQRFIRTIRFASNDRTQVQNVGAWAKTGAQSISYTPSTRELRIKDFNGADIGTKATLPVASTSAAGLLSTSDKKKLDACVTTDATYSARGLMTAQQVSALDGAAQRTAFGVFEGTAIVAEGSAVVPETSSTTSTAGKIVFVTRIGMTPTATVTRGGFLYQVGTKYYMAAPSAYGKPMPMDNGLAISTQDGCAYYLNGDHLVKAIPVATTSQSGLMSSAVYSKLNTLAQQADNIHLLNLGTFDTMSAAEAAAAALNICSKPLWESLYFTVGSNSFHIRQQVENDWCVQTIYMGRAIRQRYIHFADANRTAIAEVQPWQDSMVRNLKYTAASQQIQLQSPWNDNIGTAATIPTVSSSTNGLAPKEWLARFTQIEMRLAALENKVQALEAAAATSTADTAEAGE